MKFNLNQDQWQKLIAAIVTIISLVLLGLGVSSCNVTRTVTTQSHSIQKGDTSVVIQTKTIESYNAQKR